MTQETTIFCSMSPKDYWSLNWLVSIYKLLKIDSARDLGS